eukprot:403369797
MDLYGVAEGNLPMTTSAAGNNNGFNLTGSIVGGNGSRFNNVSETLSSLIMSRPSTHQMNIKPQVKNIKTLTRIQSIEPKNFMSQRHLNQQFPQTTSNINQKSAQKLLKLRTAGDLNRNQSPSQMPLEDIHKMNINQHMNILQNGTHRNSSHTRLQSLPRTNNNGFPDFPQSAISRGTTSGTIGINTYNDPLNGGQSTNSQHTNINLKLDLHSLKEYKSLIDQKERTISDLRSKLTRANNNFGESKMSIGGGTTGVMLKSNLMKADSLMNFRISEHTDITELKRILITLISETKQTEEVLVNRCNKVREMLDLYEARIQFDDMLFLKERDVQRMNEHIKHLTDSLVNASKNELLFNEKVREMAKCKHDHAMTKSRNEFLEKQNFILNQEVKDMKQQMVNMKELEMQMNKQRVADQNQIQVMTRRLDTLEKGLEVFQDNRTAKPDDEYKLKNTVNFLIRETQELKKDIQLKKKTIENKDREIQKLLSKIQKFLSQKNEEGLNENDDDEFGQEQLEYARDKIGGGEHISTVTGGSLVSNHDGEGGTVHQHLPAVNKFEDAKKNLEYRFKTMSSQDRSTYTELIESGSQFFVDYLLNKGDVIQVKDKFKMICEQLLKANKFIEKLNQLVHLPLKLIKKNDEKSVIQFIASEAQNVIDKTQRVTLWIKDTLNNELWTHVSCSGTTANNTNSGGEKRLQVECHTDVIGFCCQAQHTVVVQNVKESHLLDEQFEQLFQEIDPYGYKERQFVVAIPVKHPRTQTLLGILEVCLLRQASLDDYFMADALAQTCGLLLSRFQESKYSLKQTINLKKLVDQTKALIDSSNYGEQGIGSQIETVVKDIFGVQQARFIFIKDNQSIWYNSEREPKTSQNSLALEVATNKIGVIFGQPQQEKNFDGSVDISSNLPLVCYPIIDHSYLAEKRIVGVIEIPQPQLRYSGHSKSKLKDMVIDEVMKESLDTLSKIVSQVILTKRF